MQFHSQFTASLTSLYRISVLYKTNLGFCIFLYFIWILNYSLQPTGLSYQRLLHISLVSQLKLSLFQLANFALGACLRRQRNIWKQEVCFHYIFFALLGVKDKDIEDIRDILTETSLSVLLTTVVVSTFHVSSVQPFDCFLVFFYLF